VIGPVRHVSQCHPAITNIYAIYSYTHKSLFLETTTLATKSECQHLPRMLTPTSIKPGLLRDVFYWYTVKNKNFESH